MAYSIEKLIEDIKLANNGYIPRSYMTATQMIVAEEARKQGLVTIHANCVSLPNTPMDRVRIAPAAVLLHDSYDYEAAILDRQESWYFA